MARKLIATFHAQHRVRVYRDSDSDEFVARLVGNPDADAFESFNRYDRESVTAAKEAIIATAERMAGWQ